MRPPPLAQPELYVLPLFDLVALWRMALPRELRDDALILKHFPLSRGNDARMTRSTPVEWSERVEELRGEGEVSDGQAGELHSHCLAFFSWFSLKLVYSDEGTLALKERWAREAELAATTVRHEPEAGSNDIDMDAVLEASEHESGEPDDESSGYMSMDAVLKKAGISDGEDDAEDAE